MSVSYGRQFYHSRDENTRYAADRILGLVLSITGAKSMYDVGCGVGTWLRAARDHGLSDIAGVEGAWLDPSQLVIDSSAVEHCDLERPLTVRRRFDLVSCLEVAEHLSSGRAQSLIADLVRISDTVLFSAAIPDQGGTSHRHERWQSYWASLFATYSYDVFDVVRPVVWTDERIPFWYRQNILLYVRRGSAAEPALRGTGRSEPILDVVHPALFVDRLWPDPRTALKLAVRCGRRMLFRTSPPSTSASTSA